MANTKRMLVFYSLFLLEISLAIAQTDILFREDFNDLNSWHPFYFSNIEKHSKYTIITEGSHTYLRAESQAAASALIFKKAFNVYEYPKMRWRWKVENVYRKGNPLTKDGDDYPLRIYVVFKYDPSTESPINNFKHDAAKLIYGENPPHSSLNYVWANKYQPERIVINPYTEQSKMILVEKGEKNIGVWIEEEVNIVADYELSFNRKPPEVATIAIMNDSDNTGEASVSYIDFIEILR
jgi:hypothetical protein